MSGDWKESDCDADDLLCDAALRPFEDCPGAQALDHLVRLRSSRLVAPVLNLFVPVAASKHLVSSRQKSLFLIQLPSPFCLLFRSSSFLPHPKVATPKMMFSVLALVRPFRTRRRALVVVNASREGAMDPPSSFLHFTSFLVLNSPFNSKRSTRTTDVQTSSSSNSSHSLPPFAPLHLSLNTASPSQLQNNVHLNPLPRHFGFNRFCRSSSYRTRS